MSSIILKKLDNGYYTDSCDHNSIISDKVVEECMDTYEKIPGGVRLYYDEEKNVCCDIDIKDE